MFALFRYVLLTASRDWLLLGVLASVGACYGLGVFTGSAALTEKLQTSVVIFAGTARMATALGMIVFTCYHVRRSFDNREVESFLSKPLSRFGYVFGCWTGYVALALPPVIFIGAMLLLGNADPAGTALWCASVFCELALLTAFATLAALILNGAVASTLACAVFYVMSRLLGYFVSVMQDSSHGGGKLSSGAEGWLEGAMQATSSLLPRLDLFGRTSWLIYGPKGDAAGWYFFALQAAIYATLLLFMAQFDIKRKQF
ncbi:MAG: hypothetical protein ABW189_03470 [Rickettsiales bacterium]